jgi:hypothetical protein
MNSGRSIIVASIMPIIISGEMAPGLAGKPIGLGLISFLVNPGESITTPGKLRYTTLRSGFIKV